MKEIIHVQTNMTLNPYFIINIVKKDMHFLLALIPVDSTFSLCQMTSIAQFDKLMKFLVRNIYLKCNSENDEINRNLLVLPFRSTNL